MGNYRFKFSDMMPNAWFYKLRDMGKSSSRGQKRVQNSIKQFPVPCDLQTQSQTGQFYMPNRPSYYYSTRGREQTEKLPSSPSHPKASDTHFPLDSPRKSSKDKPRRKSTKSIVSSSVSPGCSCRTWKTEELADYVDTNGGENLVLNSSCSCRTTSSPTDNIIDMASSNTKAFYSEFVKATELELKPILTKPSKPIPKLNKEQSKSPVKAARTPPGLHRLKLRANSPRIVTKKVQAGRGRKSSAAARPAAAASAVHCRGGHSQTLAVVKSSSDPQKDFRDSMMEMIVENNIRSSKDLEELLACYLSLNSNEYHTVIVNVFKQLWFDLTDINIAN